MSIQWQYPEPRAGFNGGLDRFVGPGATRQELILQFGFSLVFTIIVMVYAASAELGWTIWQIGAAALLALDMAGGVATNATSAAKRWYHREGQGFRQHFTFVVIHALQIFVVAWLFRGMDWGYFAVVYGYLLVAALLILRVPLYLQRPTAFCLTALGVLLGLYVVLPTAGLEWFIPTLFLKLLLSHLVHEEPYAPPPNY